MSHLPMADIAYGYNLGHLLDNPDAPAWAQPCADIAELHGEAARKVLHAAGLSVEGTSWDWPDQLKAQHGLTLLTLHTKDDDEPGSVLAALNQNAHGAP